MLALLIRRHHSGMRRRDVFDEPQTSGLSNNKVHGGLRIGFGRVGVEKFVVRVTSLLG